MKQLKKIKIDLSKKEEAVNLIERLCDYE